jgi:hypothetical protein
MTAASLDDVVFIDFEFIADPGERPRPVCMVAAEQRSGRIIRTWLDEKQPGGPLFRTGPGVMMVAFFASAELGCCLALGHPFPQLVLDLFAEFRVRTNGQYLPHGRGLLGALQHYGLDAIEGAKKDFLRKRILAGGPYNAEERQAILDYCQSDVEALMKLYPHLVGNTDNLLPALLRGEFMKVIAVAEFTGVPLDHRLYKCMVERWPSLQADVIAHVNTDIPVFENGHLRAALVETFAKQTKLLPDWPLTDTGQLALDEHTLKDLAGRHPQIEPLRQALQMLGQLHRPGLTVGKDGRNRCLLSPFATKTGRNAPSTTKFIFGAPSFLRGLIRPEPGKALAYIDWAQQELGIAAALSGDVAMQNAYLSGDCYLSFAKYAGAVPEHATKESHPQERALFKTTILGTQYLIGANGLACRLGITLQEAEDLLDHHHRIFSRFWLWSDAVSDYGQLMGELTAVFGWRIHSSAESVRTIRNFPMQANGSEMLRLGSVFAMQAGVSIIALIHDAILIEAYEPEIEHAVALTETAMRRASELVLAGFKLRTEARIIRHPDRFDEERGRTMWHWITEHLLDVTNRTRASLAPQ